MSLVLLEENWGEIKKKVIDPLWYKKFKGMYTASRLDKDDFESLAHYELTKAFKNFDASQSNMFTYATNILQRKAKTELTFHHREKRIGDIEAESINKITDEDAQVTLEDLLVDTEEGYENAENGQIFKEILRSLKNKKEREIIFLSMQGYDDKNIAKKANTTTEIIRHLRKRLSNTPAMRRLVRRLGYSLGGIEL